MHQAEIERARRKPATNLDAYDYLLRALPMVIANSADEAPEAIELLSEALRRPGLCARPRLHLHGLRPVSRSAGAGPRRAAGEGVAHARRALELTGEDSVALAYAGFALLVTAGTSGRPAPPWTRR